MLASGVIGVLGLGILSLGYFHRNSLRLFRMNLMAEVPHSVSDSERPKEDAKPEYPYRNPGKDVEN